MGAMGTVNPYLPSDRPAWPVLPLEPDQGDGPLGPACSLRNPYWGAECWSRWDEDVRGAVAPRTPLPDDELVALGAEAPPSVPEPALLLLLALGLLVAGLALRIPRRTA